MAGLERLLNADCELVLSKVPTKQIPPSLLPTSPQQHVLHPSWIDIFPDPKLRDNMILTQGQYNVEMLFADLIGGRVHWHVYISGEYRGERGLHLMV